MNDLRRIRLEAGITQTSLAKEAGVSRQYIRLLELEVRRPTLETARAIAEALGTDVDLAFPPTTDKAA